VVTRVGGIEYHLVATERDGQWFARAERFDTAKPFGIEAGGPTEAVAVERLAQWLVWQHEHSGALVTLQAAERAYHRTIAVSAFLNPAGTRDAMATRKESLDAVEASRIELDRIRARQPW
jgi:hypothetical protein